MARRMATGATAFWLMASAGLVGVIMLQLNSELSLTRPVTAAPNDAPVGDDAEATAPLLGNLTMDVLDEIVERPLFSLSRRPFAAPVEKGAVKAPKRKQPLSVKLAGTMLAGEAKLALFTHPSQGLLRLREGQDVDGWQIVEVRDDEVRLEQAGEVTLLHLRKGVAPKPGAAVGVKKASSGKNQPPVGTLDADKGAETAEQ